MNISRPLRLAGLYLLFAMLLLACVVAVSDRALEAAVREQVLQHLQLSLDESHFRSAQNRLDDHSALQRMGREMNVDLQHLVSSRWYAPEQDCVVRLQAIDELLIDEQPSGRVISLGLFRNGLEREVKLGLSCAPNWRLALGVAGVLAVLFLGIYRSLRAPLTGVHRHWINYLLERGYSGQQAFEVVSNYEAPHLRLNPAQQQCLEQLHDPQRQNFAGVLALVVDDRVASLGVESVEWLCLGLHREPGDLEAALSLAVAPDRLEIDLNTLQLYLHGLPVPAAGTPLFYYAWYALNRQRGEGWITNPASNRPDPVEGRELAGLMARYGGHARAINDLEQSGLKARTLDQNRSKIKEDIAAALGESLAARYLFETSKHPDGVHMRYRLLLNPEQIHILT